MGESSTVQPSVGQLLKLHPPTIENSPVDEQQDDTDMDQESFDTDIDFIISTVSRTNLSTMIIIIIITVVLIITIGLGITVYFIYSNSAPPPQTKQEEASPAEKKPDNYFPAGEFSMNSVANSPHFGGSIDSTDGLSFDECKEYCTKEPQCRGFFYAKNHTCHRIIGLSDEVNIHESLSLPHDLHPLHLRNGNFPSFPDMVFLSRGPFPARYWNKKRMRDFHPIPCDTITQISFIPDRIINPGMLTGVFGIRPFTLEEAVSYSPKLVYVRPQDKIILPLAFRGKKRLWVGYIYFSLGEEE